MWEKRKPEEPVARTPYVPPVTPEVPKERFTPPPAVPVAAAEPEVPRGTAVIGKAMRIKGEIYSQEDLCINGEVEGAVEAKDHVLTVGASGKAHSNIRAREVVVLGSIHGNVEAKDKIAIRKDGRLVGDIKTAGIIIEDGAYFKGSIDIVKIELNKPVAPPKQPAVAVSAPVSTPSPKEPPQAMVAGAGSAAPAAPVAAAAKR
jgi:cytoskeletal protein CcmA (bactofilin family)